MFFFTMQKLIKFIRSHLFMFAFISIAMRDWPKKTLVWFMSENISPMLLSRTFMVPCHIFKSVSHFKFILCMVWGCVLTSLVYMWLSSFSNTTCWRDCLFLIIYPCLLCWRLIDCRCMDLFLGSLFCPIDPYVCFRASTSLFWLL